MRWVLLCVTGMVLLMGSQTARAVHGSAKDTDVYLAGPAFMVDGLKFTVPAKWISQMADNPARVGQWQVPPPPHGEGDAGQVVVFYFGQGVGGSAKENIEDWIGTMFNAEGHPAAAKESHREVGGLKISQVVAFGTYNQMVPLPGVPPVLKMNYGLVGVVIEGPQGSIFWRFTGPEPLITASLPLFNKIIDTLKPADK